MCLLAILPLILVAVWAVLPADRQARYFTLYDPDSGTATGAEASAGNYRSAGFEAALPLFYERPLLGYGPMGFIGMKRWMPHNLYGQLLAELGIAGAIAFASLFWGVGCNIVQARRIARQIRDAGSEMRDEGSKLPGRPSSLIPHPSSPFAWHTVAAVGAAYFVLAIMSWGFNFLYWQVWLWFGGFQVVALSLLQDAAVLAEQEKCLYDRAEFVGAMPGLPASDEFAAASDGVPTCGPGLRGAGTVKASAVMPVAGKMKGVPFFQMSSQENEGRRVLAVVRHPVGGIRTHLLYTYPFLAERGYTFTFVLPAIDETSAFRREVEAWPGAEVIEAPMVGVRHPQCVFIPTVRRLLRQRRFRLVHSQGIRAATQVVVANFGIGVPHVATSQDMVRREDFYVRRPPVGRGRCCECCLGAVEAICRRHAVEPPRRAGDGHARLRGKTISTSFPRCGR